MSSPLRKHIHAPNPSFADRVSSSIAAADQLWTREEVGSLKFVMAGLPITPLARLIGSVIVDHYNFKSGRCDPSVARLAGLVHTKEDVVRLAIKALVATGCLTRLSTSSSGSFLLHPDGANQGSVGGSIPPLKKGGSNRNDTLPQSCANPPRERGANPPEKRGANHEGTTGMDILKDIHPTTSFEEPDDLGARTLYAPVASERPDILDGPPTMAPLPSDDEIRQMCQDAIAQHEELNGFEGDLEIPYDDD